MEMVALEIGYKEPAQLIKRKNGPRMESRKLYPCRFLEDNGEGHAEKDARCTLKPRNIFVPFKIILRVSKAIKWLKSRHLESGWD